MVHVFVLRNAGDLTLELGDIEQFCGCTDLALSAKTLRPGERARLSVRFPLRARRGRVDKSLVVHSNDPEQPRLELRFEGEVEPDVTIQPLSILLGTVGSNQVASGAVTVEFSAAQPDVVRAVVSDSPLFRGSVEAVESGRVYRVRATTVPPLRSRHAFVLAHLRVQTDRPRSPEIEVPVALTVLSDVIVAPAELIVFAGEETPPARYAVIRPGRVRQFKVLGVQTPAPGIRATAEPLADGGYRIRIEGLRADPVLDGSRIRIRTDLGQGSEFEIPVRVLPAREPSAKPRS